MTPPAQHKSRPPRASTSRPARRHATQACLLVVLWIVGSGASCPRQRPIVNDHAPVVLTSQSSLEEIIRVVNANSARVRQVEANGATLRIDGLPPLETSYALERPRRFRLRAGISRMTGPELDMGSNDELYWMWVGRSDPPAVYWGRHDEYERSAAQRMLPVSPD